MDRDTFLTHLQCSRLLSAEQVAKSLEQLDPSAPTHVIVSALLAEGLLTPFQARRLAEGQGQGLVLGQYRLLEELGRGGFGRVYKALHTVMGRIVAVKVIAPELIEETRVRTQFKREVHAATQLYHPNIAMAYDANEEDNLLFLVMEYVEGSDLETLVRQQGPLPIGRACDLMRQVGQALQYAHELGMVHRDIKPANLLIPNSPSSPALEKRSGMAAQGSAASAEPVLVKVVDFGLARLYHSANPNSLMSQGEKNFVGTPDYVSPEQARNASTADIRSDLYSLGCTFYFALTARKPFRADSIFEVVVKHLEDEPEPLEMLRPEIPDSVVAIIRRLMAKDPNKRFQTPAQLVEELAFLCDKSPVPRLGQPSSPATGEKVAPAERAEGSATRFLPKLAFESRPIRPHTYLGTGASAAFSTALAAPLAEESHEQRVEPPAPTVMKEPTAHTSWEDIEANAGMLETSSIIAVEDCVDLDKAKDRDSESKEEVWEESLPAPPPILLSENLRTYYRQWTEIVAAFVKGAAESQFSAQAYRALHAQLLDECRAQAVAAGGMQCARLHQLVALVEPWLTLSTLAATDREALSSLLPRCQQLERELFGQQRNPSFWLWSAAMVCAFLAGVVVWYCTNLHSKRLSSNLTFAALGDAIEASPILSIVVVLPTVILVTIFLASRVLRS